MRRLVVAAALLGLMAAVTGAPYPSHVAQAAGTRVHQTALQQSMNHPVLRVFQPVTGMPISGIVELKQLPAGGTAIRLLAVGLTPGHMYRSLYYGNSSCQIEPYDASDVISGGDYAGSQFGTAFVSGMADDDLDEIHSVSIRDASMPFSPSNPGTLLACAVVSPAG